MKSSLLLGFLMCCTVASALDFPGPTPGPSKLTSGKSKSEYKLSNKVIAVTWKITKKGVFLSSITNKLTHKTFPQTDSPAFIVKSNNGGESSTNWVAEMPPKIQKIKPLKKSSSKGKLYAGRMITVNLRNTKSGLKVKWIGELRDGASYARSIIKISGDKEVKVSYIAMNNNIKLPSPKQIGNGSGMPIAAANLFFGVEAPFFKNNINGESFSQGFGCDLPIKKGITTSFASVIAVYPTKQFRRALNFYIDRERARSYSPFLLYNCWFDLERKVSEKGMLDRINTINKELTVRRKVKVQSYVVDDGYDDYKKGFWAFNTTKFPHGFKTLAKRLSQIHSHLGVWLSPSGGYDGNQERRARAAEIGIKSLNLSTPEYYKWFLNRHMRFIKDEQVNFFKWDRLGGGVSGHFMALMDIAKKLRKVNPNLFLATTVGTWPSPFWLINVDCTWRGGQDMGFQGPGDEREKWLTYRDGISYKRLTESKFIFPLNALMNHGIVFANGHDFARTALRGTKDLRNEARSYFGGGYAMQELYITPSIMKAPQWDAIAEAAKWAHKNASILVDSHFIGGDPLKTEVYGFAAWNRNQGTITLRNPSDKEQTYMLDIYSAFELPKGAKRNYKLQSPYKDQRIKALNAKAGKKIKITLKPFEVLVFDAIASK